MANGQKTLHYYLG